MSWSIEDGPREWVGGGYDGSRWSFRLRSDDGRSANVTVSVSGTALASARVPQETARAIATRGESAVREVLAWPQPPSDIAFFSDTGPVTSGGVAAEEEQPAEEEGGTEEDKVQELVDWFRERGYELVLHQPAGETRDWFAPFMRLGAIVGAAPYGWGETRLAAAEDARREFEQRPELQPVAGTSEVGRGTIPT